MRGAVVGDGRRPDPPGAACSISHAGWPRVNRTRAAGARRDDGALSYAGPMVATREADERARELIVPTTEKQRADYVRWSDRIELWVGLAVVAACCIYIFVQLQPRLLFLDTTDRRRRHRRARLVPGVPARPPAAALPARGLVARLLRGLPGRAVLLPASGAADRHPRRRPPVQRRVQARDRARADPAPDRRVRVRSRHPRAAACARAVRRRRDRLPVLQGRRRSDDEVRPPHHGRDAHEHARGRVLVHDRGRVRAVLPRHARARARQARADVAPRGVLRRDADEPSRRRRVRGRTPRS